MESWLIPAAPVTVVEEIKKPFYHAVGAYRRRGGGKSFVESVRADHPDARHHCVAWVAGRLMIRNSWGFQTMANRRERRVNRCWRS